MGRSRVLAALAATAWLSGASSATAQSQVCSVADPTGTPLNIRLQPNGQIVGRVRNGTKIVVFHGEEMRDAKGKLWYSVALMGSAAPDGYVLAAYVSCP